MIRAPAGARRRLRARVTGLLLAGSAGLAPACVVYDSGPVGPAGRPLVEGSWRIDARPTLDSCGGVRTDPFDARIVQNRDLVQLVVFVPGFGEVRWDGTLDRDGSFRVSQRTVFPEQALRDESDVEGRFRSDGGTLTATETEVLIDLDTGRSCTVVWRWDGRRR